MNYIFESIIVGIYSLILFLLLVNIPISISINNTTVLIFITGFTKHLLGYLLKIHDYYCNYGYACSIITQKPKKYEYKSVNKNIIIESILEGLLFILFYNILRHVCNIKNNLLNIFIIGVLLHIFAEKLGIHTLFCKNTCA